MKCSERIRIIKRNLHQNPEPFLLQTDMPLYFFDGRILDHATAQNLEDAIFVPVDIEKNGKRGSATERRKIKTATEYSSEILRRQPVFWQSLKEEQEVEVQAIPAR